MQSFGTKETTNNFFVAPQPKGRQPGGSASHSEGSSAGRSTSLFRFFSSKLSSSSSTLAAQAHTAAATLSHGSVTNSHGASHAISGHDSHAAPWEGVNLWRTPYKGDTDTITQVKRNKGTLDRYVENRTRRIQQLQLFALVNILHKTI